MATRSSNLSATRRSVRAARKAGFVDETDAGLVCLAETLAQALDEAMTSGEKVYGLAQAARVHLAVLQALTARPAPQPPVDLFGAFLAELCQPGAGAIEEPAARFS